MATGQAIVCEIKDHFPIPEADRIVSTSIFGENVIIGKDDLPGTRGLLIDSESQLSMKFCRELNLYRHENLNADITKKGLVEDSRRVRAIKLKKTPSTGLFLPFSTLETLPELVGISKLPIGTQLNDFNGVDICKKYVILKNVSSRQNSAKARENVCPTFFEHCDTGQLMRSLTSIKDKDLITVTQKLHGTSCRCGNLQVKKTSLWHKIASIVADYFQLKLQDYDYRFVVGSRHVLKYIDGQKLSKKVASYYKDDIWTKSAKDNFHGRLNKGETIYYEIVGYLADGSAIMPSQPNSKLEKFLDKDSYKEFIAKYGETTHFNYGCKEGEYKIFVYRITQTTEDGLSIDLTWPQVKRRCEELGVNHVKEIDVHMVHLEENVDYTSKFEKDFQRLTDAPDLDYPNSVCEGIVVRLDRGTNRPLFLKSKTTNFKILEGIIRDNSDYVDIEDNN